MNLKVAAYTILVAALFCVLAGCGEGPIKTVPVTGSVSFSDRQPPTRCELVFQPIKVEGPLRPSFTEAQPDGSYQVKAFKSSRGLIPGTYRVQVVCKDLKPGANIALESSWTTTNYDGGEVNVEAKSGGIEHNIEVKGPGKKS